NAAGQCGAVVTFSASTTGSPAPSVNYSPASGSFFPVGTTTVNVTASNSCGSANCSFTVTVQDDESPTITAPANVTASTDPGECAATAIALGTPTFSDNCPGASVSQNAPSSFSSGSHIVIWTVT